MKKAVTLGEIMLRLNPEGNYRFLHTKQAMQEEKQTLPFLLPTTESKVFL